MIAEAAVQIMDIQEPIGQFEAERRLRRFLETRDVEDRNRLAECFFPLVSSVVGLLATYSEVEDIFQDCCLKVVELIDGIEAFNGKNVFQLTRFLHVSLRNHILGEFVRKHRIGEVTVDDESQEDFFSSVPEVSDRSGLEAEVLRLEAAEVASGFHYLSQWFGIGCERETQGEIASGAKVSQRRISQIIEKQLQLVRQSLVERGVIERDELPVVVSV